MVRFLGRGGGRRGDDEVEQHSIDDRGRPDLTTFHRSADTYARLHLRGIDECDFHQRVEGQWGLIAKGQEGVPFLVSLLGHPDPEARADGASGLAAVGATDPSIHTKLLDALRVADTHEERDTLLQALGEMRSKGAVSDIADLIRSPTTDGDTRGVAVEALGKIARRRFDARPDPVAAAMEYLAQTGA